MIGATTDRPLPRLGVLLERVLGGTFGAPSWRGWRALLAALEFGLDALPAADRRLVALLTARDRLPAALRELWLIVGRRAGKSMIAAVIAVWAVTCRTYALAPGEVGVFMVIAADRRQARVVKRYISGLLRAAPALGAKVLKETAERIELKNGLVVEIHTCSFRSLRGYTVISAVADEVAFWSSEDSANPDREVLIALRAAMATVPGALLVALSTPYARRGEAWRMFDAHYGQDDSDEVLVVNAPTRLLNPTVDPAVIAAAMADDPAAARAEYEAEWRTDVEAFLSRELLALLVVPGQASRPPVRGMAYVAFVDPAGGSGTDSFTLAIAHREARGDGTWTIVDLVVEVPPPFSPEATVAAFASRLREYGCWQVIGDRYAGEWPRERFRKHGIGYVPADQAKHELYRDFLPAATSGRLELPDVPRLRLQLQRLERRPGPSGRDYIDHPRGGHDDVANAVAGAVVAASAGAARGGGLLRLRGGY